MAQRTTEGVQVGRRERKRLETRQSLINAALELFARDGFDEVTVNDIAEAGDVDASTFFRHFGSKEAVLFTDVADLTDKIGAALDARPAGEPVFDALVNAMLDVAKGRGLNAELELLRARLLESSPSLQAQNLVYRERLVREMADGIARRIGADPVRDAAPYLAASVWMAAFEFYRRRAVVTTTSTRKASKALGSALDEVLETLRPIWPKADGWI